MTSKNDHAHEMIEKFAERVTAPDFPRAQLVAEFRALEILLQPRSRGPGRPVGAKTKAATPGVKIARGFFYCEALGYTPTRAAKIVAELEERDESTVFAAMKRHANRVIEEVRAYLVHNNPISGGGFATTHPEAYQLLVATIMEFPSDSKDARNVARISMMMARLIIMEDTKSKP